jgi:thiol-disulfide isomerase/thioredoxin
MGKTSTENFLERINQNPRPVLVEVWAPWCIPCRTMEPAVAALEKEFTGRVDLWKINADEDAGLLRSLRVYGVPTVIAFHAGRERGRRTGSASLEVLREIFQSALTGVRPARTGPTPLDRILRWGAGSILVLLALAGDFSLPYLLLAGVGGLLIFSAVYDRCPVYRLIASGIRELRKSDIDVNTGEENGIRRRSSRGKMNGG